MSSPYSSSPAPPSFPNTIASTPSSVPPLSYLPPGTSPPPPPPKPSSASANQRGTPLSGPPLPPLPGSSLSERANISSPFSHIASPGPIGDELAAAAAALPQPPTIEESWIPEILKEKSTIDFHAALSDPVLLNALAHLHPSYAASQTHLQAALRANQAMATYLKEQETRLAALRASTESLLLQHQSLELTWRKKQSEMDMALEPWSPKALYQRLVAALGEQEAIGEAVEDSFLEGDGVATERELGDWVRKIKTEAAILEKRIQARARWDEGRVGGWR